MLCEKHRKLHKLSYAKSCVVHIQPESEHEVADTLWQKNIEIASIGP